MCKEGSWEGGVSEEGSWEESNMHEGSGGPVLGGLLSTEGHKSWVEAGRERAEAGLLNQLDFLLYPNLNISMQDFHWSE